MVRVFITDLQKDGRTYSFRAGFACDTSGKQNLRGKKIMKITYIGNENGIYYPNLTLTTGTTYSVGKYGRLYLDYLKKHRRGTYTTLLTENRLNEHLHQVDIEAREIVLKITEEIAVSHGIDGHLKTANPIRWVQEMNAARHDAEEIVMGNYFA